MAALAYHITWTSYGTWLPGDARGWVKWGEWGIKPPDPEHEQKSRHRMVEAPVLLSEEQRALIEQTVRDHCRIRGWVLHAVNARTNHIHVIVTADRDPDEVMKQFKAWCSPEALRCRRSREHAAQASDSRKEGRTATLVHRRR